MSDQYKDVRTPAQKAASSRRLNLKYAAAKISKSK